MEKNEMEKNIEEKKYSMMPLLFSILIVVFAILLRASINDSLEQAFAKAHYEAYELSLVRSVGGTSLAEVFYQSMGKYYMWQCKLLLEIGKGISNLILIASLLGFVNILFKHLNLKK